MTYLLLALAWPVSWVIFGIAWGYFTPKLEIKTFTLLLAAILGPAYAIILLFGGIVDLGIYIGERLAGRKR